MDTGPRLQPGEKSVQMFKDYFCGRGNQAGQREAISQLHGSSSRRKEGSFGVGEGRRRRAQRIFQLLFNSHLIRGKTTCPLRGDGEAGERINLKCL